MTRLEIIELFIWSHCLYGLQCSYGKAFSLPQPSFRLRSTVVLVTFGLPFLGSCFHRLILINLKVIVVASLLMIIKFSVWLVFLIVLDVLLVSRVATIWIFIIVLVVFILLVVVVLVMVPITFLLLVGCILVLTILSLLIGIIFLTSRNTQITIGGTDI